MGQLVSTGQITLTDVNDYTYQGTTAPKNPIPNVTVWIDTSVSPSVMKRWTGTAWEIVNEVVVGGRNFIVLSKLKSYTNYNTTPVSELNKITTVFTRKNTDGTDIVGQNVTWTLSISVFIPEAFTYTISGRVTINNAIPSKAKWGTGLASTYGSSLTNNYYDESSGRFVITQRYSGSSEWIFHKGSILSTGDVITFYDLKFEKGNKATDWTPAPEDVDSAISTAQNSANTANNLLAEIANDNILTPSEKQSTKKEWDIIVGEKSVVESQANSLGVATTSYVNAYNSLNSYITPLLANLTVNSAIVGSDFRVNFKNYYDSKITLLKAVTDKLKSNTDNIQIGGRNLILNSDLDSTILLYGVTATRENIVDNQLPSKQYFKFTNVVRTIGNYVFFIPTLTVSKFSQSLTGKKIQISFHIRTNNSQKLIFERDGSQNFMIDSTWQKVRFNTVFNGGNLHFFIEGSGLTSFDISSVKIEFGDVATDWTPAPEDIQLQIDVESAKVINLEHKTDFLTGTTIEGNAIATGTLLVGNSDGTNAGITGLGSSSDGVYLWGGGTYQQMVQGLAKKEQRRNGIDIWRHPNGQIGFEIGIKDGRLIFNGYHSDGYKLFELDPNRGLIAVAYTQESWTQTPLRKLNYTSFTFDEQTIASEINSAIIKNVEYTQFTAPGEMATIDTEYSYMITYTLLENYVGYDYDNGTNPTNSVYENLKGMKANSGDRNTNIPNGWYLPQVGQVHFETTFNSYPEPNYTFTVYVYYYTNGKITDTRVVTITK